MKLRLTSAITAALVLVAPLVASSPADANVAFSQNVRLVGQKPVSGRYTTTYTDWAQIRGTYTTNVVSSATLSTKLDAYKVADGMAKYDYYYLDADVLVTNHSGDTHVGTVKFRLSTSNATVVDVGDNKNVYASSSSCVSMSVGLSASLGVISAGSSLGSVRMCGQDPSFTRTTSNGYAYLTAHIMPKINHLTIHRVVKVLRGQRPVFNLRVAVPVDRCNERGFIRGNATCVDYTNVWAHKYYTVGTSGL
ncbi:hypothetical protein GCM10011584_12550 [Nocardioides phosphati]|uniref:Uncharacterized protein n=1 Tax=Nocardioides phosphati TaxID=1867775 RepID=A0ABQ2N8D8_9ACTN|nr:hypothetical protein [Nocardioides phosphati]GGO87579.1 hypothetical protein GCM10011584_12550 [Nocardioides phosphati]